MSYFVLNVRKKKKNFLETLTYSAYLFGIPDIFIATDLLTFKKDKQKNIQIKC